jgi:hypothetical protein
VVVDIARDQVEGGEFEGTKYRLQTAEGKVGESATVMKKVLTVIEITCDI